MRRYSSKPTSRVPGTLRRCSCRARRASRLDLRRGGDVQVENAAVLVEPQFYEGSGFFFDGSDRLAFLVLVLLLSWQLGEAPHPFLVHQVAGLVQSDLEDDTGLVNDP